jgi:hypothetical protein
MDAVSSIVIAMAIIALRSGAALVYRRDPRQLSASWFRRVSQHPSPDRHTTMQTLIGRVPATTRDHELAR